MKKWKQVALMAGICACICGNFNTYGATVTAGMSDQQTASQNNPQTLPYPTAITASQAMGQQEGDEQASQAVGWMKSGHFWYYYQNGSKLMSAMTPDGYYVDDLGMWEQKTLHIFNETIKAPERFLPDSEQDGWNRIYENLRQLNQYVYSQTNEVREFRLYEDSIIYNRVDENSETELLSLHITGSGGYQIRVSTSLGARSGKKNFLSTYDYQVLRFLCAVFSSTPDLLADAIYGSWQSNNPLGISMWTKTPVGDTLVQCDVASGTGIYDVYQRCPEQ